MGREHRSATAAATTATQVLIWILLCCCSCLGFPPVPSKDQPVRYPEGGRVRMRTNRNMTTLGGGRMVVFPDDNNPLLPTVDLNGTPSCASGSAKTTFCENVVDYPSDEIRNLIRIDKTSFQEMFGPIGINSRRTINSDELTEEGVCKHQRQTFFPKMAKNDQNLWRYVINDVDYVQAVEAEVCVKEGKACSYVQNALPGGHQSFCRQRFSFKRLLAIEPDQKKTYMDSFRFASCCSCYVKIPSLYERSGRGKTTTLFPQNN